MFGFSAKPHGDSVTHSHPVRVALTDTVRVNYTTAQFKHKHHTADVAGHDHPIEAWLLEAWPEDRDDRVGGTRRSRARRWARTPVGRSSVAAAE